MKTINNNIQEQFVSFPVAKLLKEAGLKIYTTTGYAEDGSVYLHQGGQEPVITGQNYYEGKEYKGSKFLCSRPTQQVAIDWIRVNFDIEIFITPLFTERLNISFENRKYDANIFNKGKYLFKKKFDTPEEAKEPAIEYTLTNLILKK